MILWTSEATSSRPSVPELHTWRPTPPQGSLHVHFMLISSFDSSVVKTSPPSCLNIPVSILKWGKLNDPHFQTLSKTADCIAHILLLFFGFPFSIDWGLIWFFFWLTRSLWNVPKPVSVLGHQSLKVLKELCNEMFAPFENVSLMTKCKCWLNNKDSFLSCNGASVRWKYGLCSAKIWLDFFMEMSTLLFLFVLFPSFTASSHSHLTGHTFI